MTSTSNDTCLHILEANHHVNEDEDSKRSSLNEPLSDTTVAHIKLEDEYLLVVYGYSKHTIYNILTWLLIILSCGLFGLIFYWFPRRMLMMTHSRCSLDKATKVLVEERYRDKWKSFHVKKIRLVSMKTPFIHNNKKHMKDVKGQSDSIPNEGVELSVHVGRGIFKKFDVVRCFICRKNKFIWHPDTMEFRKLTGLDDEIPTSYFHYQNGLSNIEQFSRRLVYGKNEIEVPVKSIFTLLILEILNPFYVFQLVSFVLWYLDDYLLYATAIMIVTTMGSISSIYQSYSNQRALKRKVHLTDVTRIIQGSQEVTVATEELVPGDILVLPSNGGIMYCDAVLLNGSCITNESMLTGESDPIMKTGIPNTQMLYNGVEHARYTLFCGTEILQTRFYGDKQVLALVIRTGFNTVKGSVVRSMLYPQPTDFKFEKDSLKFVRVLAIIAATGFLYTVVIKVNRGYGLYKILLESLNLITVVVPPALPAAMHIGGLHALLRLKKSNVYCTSPRTINTAGSINCFCFDKTGTLTEDGLDMWGVIPISDREFEDAVKPEDNLIKMQHPLLQAMTTCHAITIIRDKLTGDPMDLKVFESTGWKLEEPGVKDDNKYDLIIPTIVKPSDSQTFEPDLEIGIMRHFTFSSNLQRMTVITRVLGASNYEIYCKGSPESVSSLCIPETIPENFTKVLQLYTRKGYRVIAAAYRSLNSSVNYIKMQRLSREEVESQLIMLGLIILENKLKAETSPVICKLRNANIRTTIVTGDNMLTAVSVARDCGVILQDQHVLTVNCHDNPKSITCTFADVTSSSPDVINLPFNLLNHNGLDDISVGSSNYETVCSNGLNNIHEFHSIDNSSTKNFVFAITGSTWMFLKQHFPQSIPLIMTKTAVFSRMSPDQKEQLVHELKTLGYVVGMCGDGANDCGALKAADAGISLSEADASLASAFTSNIQDIRCVLNVLKECRAALVVSFSILKFMALYSLTQFMSIIILYSVDSNLTDGQYIYIDLFVITVCAFCLGHAKSFNGNLSKKPPPSSLVSFESVAGLLLHIITIGLFQLSSYLFIQQFSWFVRSETHSEKLECYENYAVFSISTLQYIILTIGLHKGPPYVQPMFHSYVFLGCILLVTISSIFVIWSPSNWIVIHMELKLPPSDFKSLVFLLAIFNFIISFLIEHHLCEHIRSILSVFTWNGMTKRRIQCYLNIEEQFKWQNSWFTTANGKYAFSHNNKIEENGYVTHYTRPSTSENDPSSTHVTSLLNNNTKTREVINDDNDTNKQLFSSQTTIHSEYFTPVGSYNC